ncbi:MAG TPA: isoleucine--tRNA ligase [Pyrinomonadaceae bacterium]|nr:isoleucine--tRNA ligase [Pyrinomonadaceae bacterium]
MKYVNLEREILDFWKREKCFEKLVKKNSGKPEWSFLDGPITANNPMGVHHAWGRTYKDIFQRYKAMTGHELRYQNGFDCQGLWVEVEVEKELGFKSKQDIEAYGIAPFVEKCKERVLKYSRIQTEQSIRLGYWMDWDNSYFTMTDENNYTIWQFLKRCHERGYIYHGWDSMPWCPRCGTGISQHEISNEERPEVTHTSPTVRFPLHGRAHEYLLVWTTTPWTLTSNVACAVHPELTYVKLRQGGDVYYLIKERVEAVTKGMGEVEVIEELAGSQMLDWTYAGPFDELPAQQGVAHYVIPWGEVSAEEGTGIVHIAPGCGKEDYELGKQFGLPPIAPIDEFGIFVQGFGAFTGQQAAEVGKPVIRSLKEKGLLYRTEEYKHAYPICWRCKTQLLFRLVDEWFISMDELRHRIIEVTKQTRWIPEIGQQLEIEWLTNMHDWMISKKRYWGLALPIYHCQSCGTFDVIGSRDELRQRAVEGWAEFDGHSPHRPWVDAVKIACSKCQSATSRIKDVGNPWLDAGIVPYSTMRYNTDRDYWNKWFPADWISESFPGQFRNWFYAILAMSTVMENRPPFKVMFGYRLMKDEKGEEMHKSKGNAVEFNEAAEREGADAMRWLYASHNPDNDLRFGYSKIHDARRQFLTLWNVYEFFLTYARVDGFNPGATQVPLMDRSELDRWILCRLQKLIESARLNYERYSIHLFMRDVLSFIDALSRWYLRRSRRRFWKSQSDSDKLAAYQTLWECLLTFAKLLAPVVPFTTEAMYQQLIVGLDKETPMSVHLCDFPQPDESILDAQLLRSMNAVLDLVGQAHAARKKAGVKVRQPLSEMRVVVAERALAKQMEPFRPLVLDELNIKEIRFVESAEELYNVSARLEPKIGKPKYGRLFTSLQESLAAVSAAAVEDQIRSGTNVILRAGDQEVELSPDEIVVEKKAKEGWALAEGDGFLILVNTHLNDDLIREGLVRDLVRIIQNQRREMGLEVTDRIRLAYEASDNMAAAISAHDELLASETLAAEISRSSDLSLPSHIVELGNEVVKLSIIRASSA